jgi:hypothetical protein
LTFTAVDNGQGRHPKTHINLIAASDHLSKVTGLSRGIRGVVFVEAFSFDFKLGRRRVRQRASPSYERLLY